jgi:hypothetical protein
MGMCVRVSCVMRIEYGHRPINCSVQLSPYHLRGFPDRHVVEHDERDPADGDVGASDGLQPARGQSGAGARLHGEYTRAYRSDFLSFTFVLVHTHRHT